MTEDFVMVFNGDEAMKLSSNGENVSQVDGNIYIEALYNEMQKNMMVTQNTSDQIINNSHTDENFIAGENFSPFKPLVYGGSKITDTDHQTVDTNAAQACSSVICQNQEKAAQFLENFQFPIDDLGHESDQSHANQPNLSDHHQNHIIDIKVVNFSDHCRFNVADQTIETRLSEVVDAGPSEVVDAGPSEVVDAGPSEVVDAGPSEVVDAGPSEVVDAGPSEIVGAGPSEIVDAGPSETVDAGPSEIVDAGTNEMVMARPNEGIKAWPRKVVEVWSSDMIEAEPNEVVKVHSNQMFEAGDNQIPSSAITEDPKGDCASSCNPALRNHITVSLVNINGSDITINDNQAGNGVSDIKPTLEDGKTNLVDSYKFQTIILGKNGFMSCKNESSIPLMQGAPTLYGCSTCQALFLCMEICKSHVDIAHSYICAFCTEPCGEKKKFEEHIVQHLSEFSEFDFCRISSSNGSSDNNLTIPVSRKRKRVKKNNFCQTKRLVENVINVSDRTGEETYDVAVIQNRPILQFKRAKCESQFNCDDCGKKFTSKGFLQRHQRKFHEEDFKCSVCLAIFQSKLALQNHSQRHMKKASRKLCSVCNEAFSTASELEEHKIIHELLFHCHVCNERYNVSSALLAHLNRRHPNAERFVCTECGKSFRIEIYLKAHIAEVHRSQRKKCRYCSKTFKSQEYLLQHIQEMHPREESKKFDCDYCNATYSTATKLKQHMTETHLRGTYECDQCLNSYATDAELKEHQQALHSSYSDILHCEFCSRSFSFKNHLDLHVNLHHRSLLKLNI